MRLQPGARLGPYEIVAPLGAGGMGEVYRARDTRLDRTVAIKIISATLGDRPDLRSCLREHSGISRASSRHSDGKLRRQRATPILHTIFPAT